VKYLNLLVISLYLVSCSTLEMIKPELEKKGQFNPIWIKNHDPDYQTGNLPIALNSPLLYEGILFVGHNKGQMKAFELGNGRKIWSADDKGFYHSTPIIYKDQLIYGTTEGRLYSRHYVSGKPKYSVDLGAAIESEPVAFRGRLFVHTRNHKIFALDAETGKILWAYKRSVPFLTTVQRVSRPMIYDQKLFVGFADGYIGAFNIEEGVLLWERKLADGNKFIDVDTTPIIFKGKLYVGSIGGPLTVIEPNTGRILKKSKYIVSRAPLKLKNRLLIGTIKGELVILDENLKTVLKKKIADKGISSIVWWKKKLAVSSIDGNLFYVNPGNLKVMEKIHLGHANSAVFGQMKVMDDKMAVLSSRNRLYVFR
jgi:outer membrane protein assembly factor BamB